MFCGKCGNHISDSAKFCPKCGAQVAARNVPTSGGGAVSPSPTVPGASTYTSPVVPPQAASSTPGAASVSAPSQITSRTKDIATAAASFVLILLSFTPLVNVNLGFVAGSYSLFDLISIYNEFSAYSSYYGTSTDSLGGVLIWFAVIVVMWIAAVVRGVIVIVNVARGKKSDGYGLILFVAYGALCIGTVFTASAVLADQLGSYAAVASSVLSATPWIWILTITSLLAVVAFYAYKPKA